MRACFCACVIVAARLEGLCKGVCESPACCVGAMTAAGCSMDARVVLVRFGGMIVANLTSFRVEADDPSCVTRDQVFRCCRAFLEMASRRRDYVCMYRDQNKPNVRSGRPRPHPSCCSCHERSPPRPSLATHIGDINRPSIIAHTRFFDLGDRLTLSKHLHLLD